MAARDKTRQDKKEIVKQSQMDAFRLLTLKHEFKRCCEVTMFPVVTGRSIGEDTMFRVGTGRSIGEVIVF
jgi:hypothetical protein